MELATRRGFAANLPRVAVAGAAIALAAYLMSRSNYVLFHTLAEGFAMLVAVLIYVVGTRTHKHSGDDFLLFLGSAYGFVAVLDFLHTATYQGMGIFPEYTSNTPTQLWIAGRYLDAASLLVAASFIGRSFPRGIAYGILAAVTAALVAAIMVFGIFPDCFVPGVGLTQFKVGSEYLICAMLLGAIWHLHLRRRLLDPTMYRLMLAAMGVTILSELSFTLYTDVYGVMNLVGHLFKILAYYLVYQGIVLRGLEAPYLEIRKLNASLERRVAERTMELQNEIVAKERAYAERERLLLAVEEQAEELRAQAEELEAQNEELSEANWLHQEAATEAERRAAELDATVGSIADGVIIFGGSGEAVLMNRAAEAMLGVTLDEYRIGADERVKLLRMESSDGKPFSADDTPAVRARRGETVRGVLVLYRTPDGRTVWGSVSAAPIRTANGEQTGVVMSISDVTRLRQLQEQRDEYIRAVSHDLRNPLTTILGQATLISRYSDRAERTKKSAEDIATSARRMNRMIGELADAARLEAGEIDLDLIPVDVSAFVDELKDRMGGPEETSRINVSWTPGTPLVMADTGRLERIMRNLISNALKYSPPDSDVDVSVSTQDDFVVTAVTDRGRGIAPEDMSRLFGRYFRARDARHAASGLGLGLYITKGLVEAHGGWVAAESEVGKGSTFRVGLPALR